LLPLNVTLYLTVQAVNGSDIASRTIQFCCTT
jgi:hypothetical protein